MLRNMKSQKILIFQGKLVHYYVYTESLGLKYLQNMIKFILTLPDVCAIIMLRKCAWQTRETEMRRCVG